MTEIQAGRVIDGRYVVEAMLGQGGMGVVLRARHRFTGAHVALKMLRPDLQFDQGVQERFLAEARTPTSIGHPGIVQVLDAGKTPEGELYLAMELLAGRPLRQAMYQLSRADIRRVLLELLDALAAAHARGIVHRDLKPENVFLVGAGATVKLLDFGIAKVVESSTRVFGAFGTAAGMLLGTVAYMAPEQLHDASSVDARADLWAVGVMLYELLAHRLPYQGNHVSQFMYLLASQDPEPISRHLPSAPPAFEPFFARALARDRDRRFASARELAAAIAALPLDGAAAPAHVSSHPPLGGAPTVGTVPAPPAHPPPNLPPPPTPPPSTPRVRPPTGPAPAPSSPAPAPAPAKGHGKGRYVVIGAVVAMLAITAIVIAGGAGAVRSKDEVQALCASACQRLSWCGMTSGCEHICQADRRLQDCMNAPDATCDSVAQCYVTASCGKPPSGTATCAQTAECQGACGKLDRSCMCGCLERLVPGQASQLLQLNACVASCPDHDVECARQRCLSQATACAAQPMM